MTESFVPKLRIIKLNIEGTINITTRTRIKKEITYHRDFWNLRYFRIINDTCFLLKNKRVMLMKHLNNTQQSWNQVWHIENIMNKFHTWASRKLDWPFILNFHNAPFLSFILDLTDLSKVATKLSSLAMCLHY